MRGEAWTVLGVAGVLAAAGCGGSTSAPSRAAGTMPACAGTGRAAKLPAAFPSDLPIPAGTVLEQARDDGKTILVEGKVPSTIRDAAKFFLVALPKAGYPLGEGDSEADEAESH